jgi:trimeric autotransporter adhesin
LFAIGAVDSPSSMGYTLAFGDGMTVGGRSAYVDDRRFAAIESDVPSTSDQDGPSVDMPDVRLYLVSAGLTDAASLLPSGVSPCDCDFMRWGFWGGDFTNSISGQRERVHLGQWVAGDLASAGEIAGISGIGTYAGHAIADIANAGRVYKAGGGFDMSYNFSTRIGTANVTNLDGINYSATVSAFSGLENMPSGTLNGTGGGGIGAVSGPLNLGFYRNGSNPAAGVGGGFKVNNGGGYSATGIVIGRQTSLDPGS